MSTPVELLKKAAEAVKKATEVLDKVSMEYAEARALEALKRAELEKQVKDKDKES